MVKNIIRYQKFGVETRTKMIRWSLPDMSDRSTLIAIRSSSGTTDIPLQQVGTLGCLTVATSWIHLFCGNFWFRDFPQNWTLKMERNANPSQFCNPFTEILQLDPTSANDTSRALFSWEGCSKWLDVTSGLNDPISRTCCHPPIGFPGDGWCQGCWCQWLAFLCIFSSHEHMAGSKKLYPQSW